MTMSPFGVKNIISYYVAEHIWLCIILYYTPLISDEIKTTQGQ